MARIQQSIEVNAPVRSVYEQLTQFEQYPRFMQDVRSVRRLDDKRLHWDANMSGRNIEWDAEITEQVPDRCISWRSMDGMLNAGRIELQPMEQDRTRILLTMEADAQQTAPEGGNAEATMAQTTEQNLVRLKTFIESGRAENDGWRGDAPDSALPASDRDGASRTQGSMIGKEIGQTASERHDAARSGYSGPDGSDGQPAPVATYAAGSEGWDGNEDPGLPIVSSAGDAEGQEGTTEKMPSSRPAQPFGQERPSATQDPTMQSAASLSQSSHGDQDEGQFSIAEEQNFDQQSAQARRVGHMPKMESSMADITGQDPVEAMLASVSPGQTESRAASRPAEARLADSIEQAVPLSPSGSTQASQAPHAASAGHRDETQSASPNGRQSFRQQSAPHRAQHAGAESGPQSWLPNLLQSWDEPLVMMRKMREEMDQIFEKFVGRTLPGMKPRQDASGSASAGSASSAAAVWSPPVEVAQHDHQVVVFADLPGVKREDVHVEIKKDKLIIEGDRHEERHHTGSGLRRSERSYGHFYRVISLPDGVDADGASASMHDGILEVTVPVHPVEQQGKRLDIRSS